MASTDVTTLKMLLVGEDRSASKTLRDVGTEADKAGEQLKGMGEDAAAGARLFEELPKNAKGAVDRSSAVFKQLAPEVKRAVIDASDTFQLLDQLPKTAEGVVDETSRSFRELSPKMQDAVRDAQSKAAAEFKGGDTERAARRAGEDAGEAFGDGVEDGADDAKSGFLSKIKGWKAGAVGALAAVGAAAIGGFTSGMDLSTARAKLTAQLGLTTEESQRAGAAAGSLYRQAFGENVGQTSEAIKSVIENIDGMRDASEAALTDMGARVITTADLLGEDLGPVARAVGQMMRTGMAKDAEEAFDIITAGMQNGVNKAEDLLDTINEYGTQFRKLGLDGKESMGLLSQGVQAGARDADVVADAIKEFSIRTLESLETVDTKGNRSLTALGQGFQAVLPAGADLYKVQEDLAAGGPRARAAFDQMLDGLRNIEDPALRTRTAVALFGTQAEDLGDALYALDPSEATKGLGDLADASDRANESLVRTPMAKVTGAWRAIKGAVVELAADGLDRVIPLLKDMREGWQNNTGPMGNVRTVLGVLLKAGQKVTDWIREDLVPWMRDLYDSFVESVGGADGLKKSWRDMQPVVKVLTLVLKGLWEGLKWAASVIVPAIGRAFKDTMGIIGALGRLITWLWNGAFAPALRFIVRGVANLMDMWAGLLRALGRIPGFGWAKDAAVKMQDAANRARALEMGIRNIPNRKDIVIQTTYKVSRQMATGGNVLAPKLRAGGGPVFPGVAYKIAETNPETVTFDRAGRVDSGRGHHRSSGGMRDVLEGQVLVIVQQPDGTLIQKELVKLKRRQGGKPLEFETTSR